MANDFYEKNYARVHYMEGKRTNNEVLKNKLGITDNEKLSKIEDEFASRKSSTAPKYDGSIQSTNDIHKHLFEDIYEWAGQYRDYPTSRDPESSFAMPDFIENQIKHAQKQLGNYEDIKKGMSVDDLAPKLAKFSNELNAAHPYIDGNGRVNRMVVMDVAEKAGYELNLSKVTQEQWYSASKESMVTFKDDEMIKIMKDNLIEIEKSAKIINTKESEGWER